MTTSTPSKLRTLLILGRTSNLPTVWSNCLAGWWLGGGGNVLTLVQISVATTLMYLGGMFLNDAFDVAFDREHRKNRPIPSGVITEREVWQWGLGLLVLGILALVGLGKTTALLTLCLAGCILLYDAVHKAVSFAPVLMAGCRFFLYLVAASVATNGVTGNVVWCAVALASYIVGLSYLARKESIIGALPYWSAIFLTTPFIIAYYMDDDATRAPAYVILFILLVWIGWALHFTIGKNSPNIGATVSRLLAGIILVDLLVLADKPVFWPLLALWFLLALLFQRFIPAT